MNSTASPFPQMVGRRRDLGLIDIVAKHFVSAGNKAHINFVADLFFVNISAGNDGSNIYMVCVFRWENGNFGSNIYATSIVDRELREGSRRARRRQLLGGRRSGNRS